MNRRGSKIGFEETAMKIDVEKLVQAMPLAVTS